MRIGWITPLSQSSAIARITVPMAQDLADRGHEITLISSDLDGAPDQCTTDLPSVHWDVLNPLQVAEKNDILLMNVGDNYLFHAGIFPFLSQAPVGIFHDFYLYNLFRGWLTSLDDPRMMHDHIINVHYPDMTPQALSGAWNGTTRVDDIAQTHPMTEWLAERCSAALAHANFYVDRLATACPGPVAVAHMGVGTRWAKVPEHLETGRGALRVVTLGVQNPNKCADRVIRALAGVRPHPRGVQYRLVGPISHDERQRLTQLAVDSRVELVILGAVDDLEFEAEVAGADIVCCLRRPVLEGSSASAIEGLLAGRPLVVVDAGFYAEIPSDLVCKVLADVPIDDLSRVLDILIKDHQMRHDMGARAKDWAIENFSIRRYVSDLEALAERAVSIGPLCRVSKTIGQEFVALGIKDQVLIDRISARMQELFQP